MLVHVLTLVAVLQISACLEDVNVKGIDPKLDIVTIGNHRYYFSQFSIDNHAYAMRSCQDVGASLVSLETEEEFNNVTSYITSIAQTGRSYWTSGVYLKGNWLWSGTGRLFSFIKWNTGEPDQTNSEGQACVYLYSGGLNDQSCSYRDYYVICEEDNCS